MNTVPYSMIWTSNTQAWGVPSAYLENTSQQIITVRITMAHAASWPSQVEILSTVRKKRCMVVPGECRPTAVPGAGRSGCLDRE